MDWSRTAIELHNQVRGLHPWPHAQTTVQHRRVLVLRSAPIDRAGGSLRPGTIEQASGDELVVAAGRGSLRLLSLQLEGRRAISSREFLAGHRLQPGTRLGDEAGP